MNCDTIIFDGSHAAHRLSAANPPLNNSKGLRVEVIFGLLRLLSSVLRANPATCCQVVWDGKGSRAIRQAIDPDYKAHRVDKDDGTKERIQSMHEQLDRFWEQFGQYLPIHWVTSTKFEADDLIAMLARSCAKEGDKVLIVSGDKDLLQLVSTNITVYSPFGNKYCSLDNFSEYTGGFPTPMSWLYAKCLMGDSSDNVKGIGGVGEATAKQILAAVNWDIAPLKYGHCPGVKGKLLEKIQAPETWLRIARNYKLCSLCAPVHQGFNPSRMMMQEGQMNEKTIQMNLAKNQFASILGAFTMFINPFRLLER